VPDLPIPPDPDLTPGHRAGQVRRRVVLAAGLAVTGGLALAGGARPAAARPDEEPGDPEFLDVSDDEARQRPGVLRLRLDNTDPCCTPVPRQLVLGTSRDGEVKLVVTSEQRRAMLGLRRDGSDRSWRLDVTASKDRPVAVWVFPHEIGAPQAPADRIVVAGPHGRNDVDVWIEPTGGQWRYLTGHDKRKLDLEIVAIHAAVVRKAGTNQAEVLMYSLPRVPNPDGTPKQNPDWSEANQQDVERWYWSAWELGGTECRVLDLKELKTRKALDIPKMNMFCSGQAHQPDGGLLVVGGHVATDEHHDGHDHAAANDRNGHALNVYDAASGKWLASDRKMPGPLRWYPSVTALPDGRMLVTTGAQNCYLNETFWTVVNKDYLVYDPVTGTCTAPRDLVAEGVRDEHGRPWVEPENPGTVGEHCVDDDERWSRYIEGKLATYPGVFVVPGRDGGTMVALVESNRIWLYDYGGAGEGSGPLTLRSPFYRMHTKGSRSYPWYGSMVLLPLGPGDGHARILAAGGQHEDDTWRLTCRPAQSTATAEILQIDPGGGLTRRTVPMHHSRFLCDATLLADGTVLVSGGSQEGWTNQNQWPVYHAELFDPDSGTFHKAARADTDRRYHSVALLLPDGTVFKAGSTGGFDTDYDAHNPHRYFRSRTDAELFLPPYLWRGPRPKIEPDHTSVVRILRYGEEFTVAAHGPGLASGARVAIIRLGAATHGNDMDQRYVWLEVRGQEGDGEARTLTAAPPANPAAAPPGDYLLVVVDGLGVPSEGEVVTVAGGNLPGQPAPA
jgi:hypothetical protein